MYSLQSLFDYFYFSIVIQKKVKVKNMVRAREQDHFFTLIQIILYNCFQWYA